MLLVSSIRPVRPYYTCRWELASRFPIVWSWSVMWGQIIPHVWRWNLSCLFQFTYQPSPDKPFNGMQSPVLFTYLAVNRPVPGKRAVEVSIVTFSLWFSFRRADQCHSVVFSMPWSTVVFCADAKRETSGADDREGAAGCRYGWAADRQLRLPLPYSARC